MKTKAELDEIVREIAKPDTPVGMDPVHVHAIIIDKLTDIQARLERLEAEQAKKSFGIDAIPY
jgi:hypothetical protein